MKQVHKYKIETGFQTSHLLAIWQNNSLSATRVQDKKQIMNKFSNQSILGKTTIASINFKCI